jgi:hypothetical protein
LSGLGRQRLHLDGDDDKTAAGFASARRLDRRVERKQVCLAAIASIAPETPATSAADFFQTLFDACHRIDQRCHTIDGGANCVTRIFQIGAGRFGGFVSGVGGAVDLPVGIQHHIGAAAQALELRFLALDLLGNLVDVACGFVDLEAHSPESAAKRGNERTRLISGCRMRWLKWLWGQIACKLTVGPDHREIVRNPN